VYDDRGEFALRALVSADYTFKAFYPQVTSSGPAVRASRDKFRLQDVSNSRHICGGTRNLKVENLRDHVTQQGSLTQSGYDMALTLA
jgi:hypothetical protein